MKSLLAEPLTKEEIEALIDKKVDWITSASTPLSIYLVGSAKEGRMTTASDIDLVVVYDTQETIQDQKDNLYKKRPQDDWSHDMLLVDEEKFHRSARTGGGLCWLAQSEGQLIYSAQGEL